MTDWENITKADYTEMKSARIHLSMSGSFKSTRSSADIQKKKEQRGRAESEGSHRNSSAATMNRRVKGCPCYIIIYCYY